MNIKRELQLKIAVLDDQKRILMEFPGIDRLNQCRKDCGEGDLIQHEWQRQNL